MTPDCATARLEGVPQRELDKAWRAYGRKDLAERPGIGWSTGDRVVGNCFHVVDGRIREVRMIPDIKEIRCEPELLVLGNLEIFYQREVPVLLKRPTIDVTAEIAKKGDRAVAPVRGWNERRGGKVGHRESQE